MIKKIVSTCVDVKQYPRSILIVGLIQNERDAILNVSDSECRVVSFMQESEDSPGATMFYETDVGEEEGSDG